MHFAIFLLSATIFWATPTPRNDACGCYTTRPAGTSTAEKVDYEFSHSSAVFSGKVLRVEAHDDGDLAGQLVVTFQVAESWKGVDRNTITVTTDPVSNCGYDFEVAQNYLVYVENRFKEMLQTSACSRTMKLGAALEDLEILRRRGAGGVKSTGQSVTSDATAGEQAVFGDSVFSGFPTRRSVANLPSVVQAPSIPLQKALKLAEAFVAREKIDVANCYLFSIDLHRDAVQAEPVWRFFWVGLRHGNVTAPDVWVAVSMDGRARRYTLKP